jgi:hypothetical protein
MLNENEINKKSDASPPFEQARHEMQKITSQNKNNNIIEK